jgi:putative ABC transport system substrate-binding protein
MRRREFIKLLGGAAAMGPIATRAQPRDRMRRVGILLPATADDKEAQTRVGAFLQGLGHLGWGIGDNVRIEPRWAGVNASEIQKQAAELVALSPDIILAHGGAAVAPLLQMTRSIPIVFPIAADPVGAGLVESLPRSGGNVTGFMTAEYSMGGKRLELLKEIAPRVKRVASHSRLGRERVCGDPGFRADLKGGGQPGQHARCVRD